MTNGSIWWNIVEYERRLRKAKRLNLIAAKYVAWHIYRQYSYLYSVTEQHTILRIELHAQPRNTLNPNLSIQSNEFRKHSKSTKHSNGPATCHPMHKNWRKCGWFHTNKQKNYSVYSKFPHFSFSRAAVRVCLKKTANFITLFNGFAFLLTDRR